MPSAHECTGAGGSHRLWWASAREKQVCHRPRSGHPDRSMFKATASSVVFTDLGCAKQQAKEIWRLLPFPGLVLLGGTGHPQVLRWAVL